MMMMMTTTTTTTSFTQMTTEIVFHMTTHQVHGCFHYQEYDGSKPTPWLLCEVWWKQMSQLLLSRQRWWKDLSKKVATNHDPILGSHAFNHKNCQISETTLECFLGDSSQSPLNPWMKRLWWGFFTTCPLWSSSLSSVWSVPLAVDSWCLLEIITNGARCRRTPQKWPESENIWEN